MPGGYTALYERALAVLGADERVRAVWLGGSLARGTADAASDLDLLVSVTDDAHEAFAGDWRRWLAEITPTVLAEELWFAKGSVYSVTPEFLRLDVVVEPVSAVATTMFRRRVAVLDRDGLAERLPAPDDGPGPSAGEVSRMVREFFRTTGMPEVLTVRQDWLLATEHIHQLRLALYDLYVEANKPAPPMGVKQWSARLTPAQRDAMASLPTGAASVEELADAHVRIAREFLAVARPLVDDWPHELEAAARAHVRDVLGIDEPYPP